LLLLDVQDLELSFTDIRNLILKVREYKKPYFSAKRYGINYPWRSA
jgi:hypothetical protein